MPNLDISIDRTGLTPSTDLVLTGERTAGWCLMPGWQLPPQLAQTRYVTSDVQHGDVPVSWKWQHAALSGDVLLHDADPADRTTAIDELRAALARLEYTVTVDWNGEVTTWRCDPGSMTPSQLTYISVSRDEPVYSLTIPCYPLPEV